MGEMVGLGENWELGWKICTANVTCWGQTNKGKKEIIPVEIFPAIKAVMMIISPLIKIVVPVKMTNDNLSLHCSQTPFSQENLLSDSSTVVDSDSVVDSNGKPITSVGS